MPEIIFILVLALLIFGPKRLPQVGRTLGRGLREFRSATNDLKRTVETEISNVDIEPARPIPTAAPGPDPTPPPRPEPAPDRDDEPEDATADAAAEETAFEAESTRTD